MKIALVSDIHGNLPAFEAVLRDAEQAEVGAIHCLGDAIGYYPYANEVLELVKARVSVTVLGNHEAAWLAGKPCTDGEPVSEESFRMQEARLDPAWKDMIGNSPLAATVPAPGGPLLLSHGSPWSVDEYVYAGQFDFGRFGDVPEPLVAVGHTHRAMLVTSEGKTIINPGSVGQARDVRGMASYLVISEDSIILRRVPYDVESLCQDLKREGISQELVRAVAGDAT